MSRLPTTRTAQPLTHALARPNRRTWLASALGLAGGSVLTLSGCGGASSSSAALRFVNATADYSTADFWALGDKLSSALANGGMPSGWFTVDADDGQVELHAAGSSTAKLSETHSFAEDSYTSAIAYGALSGSVKFKYLDESNAHPSSGSVKVRVFQAASSLSAMDVYISNTSSLSGLSPTFEISAYEALSSFVTLDSGAYRIRITASGDKSTVLYDYTTQVSLSSQAVVTLVVVPRSSGSLPNICALAEQGGSALLANTLVS